ncbi:fibronectin type III domain-containing protein [Thiocapsa sp.]|nr:fibronectin type III domain-containing protein [Thiocapsa sp.]
MRLVRRSLPIQNRESQHNFPYRRYLLALLLCLSGHQSALASSSVTLQWNPALNDSRIAGYEIHVGTSSGTYRWVYEASDKGAATRQVSISGKEQGKTYYFAIRAINHDRSLISPFSKEIGHTIGDATQNSILESDEVWVGPSWQWVSFTQTFTDPIVVASSSESGSHPSVIRIEGVEPSGFWIRLEAWDYLSRDATTETVNYIAMERGRHRLPNGSEVMAGRLLTDPRESHNQVSFTEIFRETPIVVTNITSNNGNSAVTTMITSVERNGFSVGITEQESNTQKKVAETIDFIAWEPSKGTIDGTQYLVARTPQPVDHRPFELDFGSSFADPPLVLAHAQTIRGSDPFTLRWSNKTSRNIYLRLVEEQSLDAELLHHAEEIGYLLLGR